MSKEGFDPENVGCFASIMIFIPFPILAVLTYFFLSGQWFIGSMIIVGVVLIVVLLASLPIKIPSECDEPIKRKTTDTHDLRVKEHLKSSDEKALLWAYDILGCDPSSTDDVVKKAYHVAAKRNHPDALASSGASNEIVDFASQRFADIKTAWDLIAATRGI